MTILILKSFLFLNKDWNIPSFKILEPTNTTNKGSSSYTYVGVHMHSCVLDFRNGLGHFHSSRGRGQHRHQSDDKFPRQNWRSSLWCIFLFMYTQNEDLNTVSETGKMITIKIDGTRTFSFGLFNYFSQTIKSKICPYVNLLN